MASEAPLRAGFHTLPVLIDGVQIDFTIPQRYTNLRFISAGAQGTVVSAEDTQKNMHVAIKKMQNSFLGPKSAQRTIREFLLLTSVTHPNIVQTYSVFTPQETKDSFKDIYLVMELMSNTLQEVRKKVKLPHLNLSYFIYQILCGVNHLHRENILHRDLKPTNIAVNAKSKVKVLDFGLARLFKQEAAAQMTAYVVTRHYRAPEIVLELPYTEKSDIWSIGCIFAELITGKVLFEGADKNKQWEKIVNIVGTPTEEFVSRLEEVVAERIRSLPTTLPKPLVETIPDSIFTADPSGAEQNPAWTAANARDLISKMLEIDPNVRCSAAEALEHPYVAKWRMEQEVNAPLTGRGYDRRVDELGFELRDASDEAKLMFLQQLKDFIFNEVKLLEATHKVL